MMFLFDIDGTLVLTGGAGARALDRAFHELLGIERAMDGIAPDGKTDPLIVLEVFAARLGRAPSSEESDRVLGAYLRHLETEVLRADRYRIMPGALTALNLLEGQNLPVGLATGNLEQGARIKLERGGLWHRFPFGGFASDSTDRRELVARAIARGEAYAGRRVSPRDVFVVGDTPRDVDAAHGCGATAIAVATGSHSLSTLRTCGADVVMETLEEFPGWLAKISPP
ncbi:MAG: HAD family hydrolase [Deltaproteobacteria bacterium]|nr:HAD family hydrolase [Deltaproteobacteria bacterium]